MVPDTISCPHCAALSTAIRAWRAFAQIFYVCGVCDAAWTVDLEPSEQATDVIEKLKRALS